MTRVEVVLLISLLAVGGAAESLASEAEGGRGRFVREYWYEPGIEHGNPRFDGRFRVNAPEVVLDPRFMYRSEVRENGLMMSLLDEDLARARAVHVEPAPAELGRVAYRRAEDEGGEDRPSFHEAPLP